MAVWSNRILIFLGALGIFIASVLSYSSWKVLLVPCGGTLNCSLVLDSPFATFMGVNVSYIGLAGYVAMFSLAVLRSTQTGVKFRRLGVIGFVMSAVGLVFSLYLTYASITFLQMTCRWCLSSLAVMLVTTILHAALLQGDAPKEKDLPFGSLGSGAMLMVALGIAGFVISKQVQAVDIGSLFIDTSELPLEKALPKEEKLYGGQNAKVTVIEFADINCGACRTYYPLVKKVMQKHGDGVRLGFRHFPLINSAGHETSIQAAVISEFAAEKGEFWKYMDTVMDPKNEARIKTMDGLIAVASELGYSRGELSTFFSPVNDEQTERGESLLKLVSEDMDIGLGISVQRTPTFLIYAEGVKEPKAVSFNQLDVTLMSSPYRELIESGK